MARSVEGPWFRASKNGWYATHQGRKVSLGVKGEAARTEAVRAWHRLMAGLPTGSELTPPKTEDNEPACSPSEKKKAKPALVASEVLTVTQAADLFFSAITHTHKPTTVRLYRNDVGQFCGGLGSSVVSSVSANDIARWLLGLAVKPTTKGIMLRSVGAFFGWCVRQGLTPTNPVKSVPKPKARSRSREAVVGEEEHARLVATATPLFRLVLETLHATGCRPGEAAALTVENTDLSAGVAVLEVHKCDRHGKPRLVFLPPTLCVKLTALDRTSGPLLRTHQRNAWTGRSITQAMRRACQAAGVRAIAYGYRHAYATEALSRGVPDAQVAALLGHSGTGTLHQHYSHLTSRAEVLKRAAATLRG